MATKKKKKKANSNLIAKNKKAYHNYFIEEKFEAGIVLKGSEVKSLRDRRGSINETYAGEKDGELYLFNAHIPEYPNTNPKFQHQPNRPRKLLLHRREIDKILGALQKKGMTLLALSMYFNNKGLVKVELGLAKGKKLHDKRETEKKRDWDKQKARLLRDKG